MSLEREKIVIIISGLIIGVIAGLLVVAGNPANMGFCIACFIRDTVGGLGLHRAGAVQYIRPEIIGLLLEMCIRDSLVRCRAPDDAHVKGQGLIPKPFFSLHIDDFH